VATLVELDASDCLRQPGPDLVEASERGEVVIGGCVVMGDDPGVDLSCVRQGVW
jgi:hypothetical protein